MLEDRGKGGDVHGLRVDGLTQICRSLGRGEVAVVVAAIRPWSDLARVGEREGQEGEEGLQELHFELL